MANEKVEYRARLLSPEDDPFLNLGGEAFGGGAAEDGDSIFSVARLPEPEVEAAAEPVPARYEPEETETPAPPEAVVAPRLAEAIRASMLDDAPQPESDEPETAEIGQAELAPALPTGEPEPEPEREMPPALPEREAQAALPEREVQPVVPEPEAQAAVPEPEAQAAVPEREAQAAVTEREAQAARVAAPVPEVFLTPAQEPAEPVRAVETPRVDDPVVQALVSRGVLTAEHVGMIAEQLPSLAAGMPVWRLALRLPGVAREAVLGTAAQHHGIPQADLRGTARFMVVTALGSLPGPFKQRCYELGVLPFAFELSLQTGQLVIKAASPDPLRPEVEALVRSTQMEMQLYYAPASMLDEVVRTLAS